MSNDQQSGSTPRPGPKGIGGWLILPLIGLFVTPLRGAVSLVQTYSGISAAIPSLTTGQASFILAEFIFNVLILLIAPLVLIVLLFTKKRAFVRVYTIWGLGSLIGMFADLVLARVVFPGSFPTFQSLFDSETVMELFRSFILAAIWVPYMVKSRRVANTFVN